MPLRDCVIATSTEVIDQTLSAGEVSLSGSVISNAGYTMAALDAVWTAAGLSPYVTGIQFEITPPTGNVTISEVRIQYGTWAITDGIVGALTYSIRYRAMGAPGVFGPWQGPTTVMASSPVSPAPPEPGATAWSANGTTLTGADGTAFPAITLSGAFDASFGTGIFVEISPHNADTWTAFGAYGIATTNAIIDSVSSGEVVDIAVSYLNNETQGDRRVLDNAGAGYTAGSFASSGTTTDKTPAAVDWTDQTASGLGTQSTTTNTQTISGINVPITLELDYTNTASWSYSKNGGALQPFSTGGVVAMVSGDTLAFVCTSAVTVTSVLTIKNLTDGSATLDTTTSALTVTAVDVTPDAIAWSAADGQANASSLTVYTSTATFSGINVPINVEFDISIGGGPTPVCLYSKNGASFVSFTSGTAISFVSGDSLRFGVRSNGGVPSEAYGTITVKNLTDSSAVLNTIDYDISLGPLV